MSNLDSIPIIMSLCVPTPWEIQFWIIFHILRGSYSTPLELGKIIQNLDLLSMGDTS